MSGKKFVQTLICGVFFLQAGSAGFVVSLAMQCSQDLMPFAGKTLHDIWWFTVYLKIPQISVRM